MSKTTWLKAASAAGLAVLTALSLTGSAHAAPGDTLPPTTGDLVIHKYIGAPVSGGERTGAALDTSAWTDVTPANGVVFDLFQVGAPLAATPAWPDVPGPGTYVRDAANGTLEVYSGATLAGVYGLTAASPASVTTGPNGTATAADLPQGLYLVTENSVASTGITNANTGEPMSVSQMVAPFLVAVPMTNASGDGWLDVVHVYPKNEALTIDKVVDAAGAVAVGDTVSYTITVSVPGDIATSLKFAIYDKLDPALTLDLASVTVSTLPALSGADALIKNADYNITYDTVKRTLSIVFTDSGRVKLAKAGSVVVTLDTTINASILTAPGMTVPNTATVQFTNEDNLDFEADSGGGGGSEVHSAKVTVTKVDQAGQALNGASFAIATSEANAKAGHFLRLDAATQILHDYDASATSTWATLGAAADYTINPANSAAFTGLRDVVDAGGTPVWQSYWVVETQAPATYNLLADPIKVSFEDAFNGFADPADYDHTYLLTVKNSKGFILPETGGAGTIALTVAGVALLGSAVLLGVTKRKKDAAQRA